MEFHYNYNLILCLLFLLHWIINYCHFRNAQAQYKQYKQRCNAFFMQLVGRLCFEGNMAPDGAVVHKLLQYVIHSPQEGERLRTRRPHVLPDESSIDPSPVVRLFLLQLLLRSKWVCGVVWLVDGLHHVDPLVSAEGFVTGVAIKTKAFYTIL